MRDTCGHRCPHPYRALQSQLQHFDGLPVCLTGVVAHVEAVPVDAEAGVYVGHVAGQIVVQRQLQGQGRRVG